ncbi:hypothetical protein HPO96_26770 [Kribbella sandramycini]|uniref:Uncharacterized protein n=1 Tax=Kribbella sandramycini TaxID=60450 RepID=A0A7Y4L5K1_9ACTN|nr:hypothetical protein [Kribbella sandramycini]MBB6570714.1 hypothetical protein [Kribbella sandramycini]NOL43857.1 hypothetical protein [Kribbella sandramycini]
MREISQPKIRPDELSRTVLTPPARFIVNRPTGHCHHPHDGGSPVRTFEVPVNPIQLPHSRQDQFTILRSNAQAAKEGQLTTPAVDRNLIKSGNLRKDRRIRNLIRKQQPIKIRTVPKRRHSTTTRQESDVYNTAHHRRPSVRHATQGTFEGR